MKGVYKIINTVNGKFYVGSSKDIPSRVRRHFYDLKRNSHHSAYFQRAYNKYGKESFTHEVVLECDNFIEEEQKLLDNLDWSLAYNVSKAADGGDTYTHNPNKEARRLQLIAILKPYWENTVPRYGKDNSNWRGGISSSICKGCGKKLTGDSDFCRPCYFAQRDISGEKNPFFGKSHSNETIEKLRKRTPTTQKVVIDDVEYPSMLEASKALKAHPNTITNRVKNPKFPNYRYKDNCRKTSAK
jgi:group I intron endonuclease